MNEYPKFIIYYKPAGTGKGVNALTLSFSRLSTEDNTYKQKLILEYTNENGQIEEYKIKEFHIGANEILEKIDNIDFSRFYINKKEYDDQDYILIKYGNKKIETTDKKQVDDILNLFKFNDLMHITRKHFKYIKDMYEYVDLVNILNSKLNSLSGKQMAKLSHLFSHEDPYRIFQSMAWLPEYLDSIEN